MLGIGKGITKGNPVRSVVKKGLQAWYKADKTQAPLGEQEIANGDFSLGPEALPPISGSGTLYTNESLAASGGNVGLVKVPSDDLTLTYSSDDQSVTISDTTNASSNRFYFTKSGGSYLEKDKTYLITYTVVSSNTTIQFYHGSSGGDYNDVPSTVGTHTYILTLNHSGLMPFYINTVGIGKTVKLKDISVKQTNPNDSWTLDSAPTGATVFDGYVFLDNTNSGTASQSGILTVGKKYQYTFTAKSVGGNGDLTLSDGSTSHLSSIDIPADYTIYSGSFVAANTNFTFSESSSGDVSIKDVSCKEITNSVRDHSSNNNNAVLYSGKALDFDNQDDENISIGTQSLPNTSTVTGSFWMYPVVGGSSGVQTIMSYSKFMITLTDNDTLTVYPNTAGTAAAFTIPDLNGKWSRVVVSVDGLTTSLYINGDLVESKTTIAINNAAANSYIASEGGARYYEGKLADLQIYGKAWTASDVTYDWENPDKDVFDRVGEAQVLGEELNDLSWVANGGWSTDGDIASNNGGGSTFTNDILELGKTYQFKCKLSSYTSGDFRLMLGGSTISTNFSSTDEFTFIGVCAGDTSARVQSLSGDGSLSISSLTIKEVTTHASHILPTDCKALYRLNEGAGDRVYNAAPVLGANLLSGNNSTFDGANNWAEYSETGTTGVSTSDGILTVTLSGEAGANTDSGAQIGNTYNGFSINKLYLVSADVWLGTATATDFKMWMGADFVDISPTTNRTTFSGYLKPTNTGTLKIFENQTGGDSGTFFVDNISVKEISLPNSYVQANFVADNWITAQPYIPQYAMSSYSKKMVFDGSNDYVALGSKKTIATDEAFSISFWFSANQDSVDEWIIGTDDNDSYIRINPGSPDILELKSEGTASYFDLNEDYTIGKINHIVLTAPAYSSGSEVQKFYFNGVLQADTENRANTAFEYYWMGKAKNGSDNNAWYEGFLDEVAHFSKELSATEVSELFNGGMALDARDHSAYLGSELVTNGDFSTSFTLADDSYSGGWDLGSTSDEGVSIENGQLKLHFPAGSDTDYARVYASSGSDNNIKPADHAGKIYELKYDIISKTGTVLLRGYNGGYVDLPSEIGTNTYTFTSSPTNRLLVFKHNDADQTIVLDNIQLKEVQLQGYWRNNGVDTWTDLSEYGNDGTVNGSPTTIQLQEVPYFKKDTLGLPMNKVRQKGLNFDGDSYVEIDDDNSLDITTGLTMEAWVKFNDFDYSYNIMQKKNVWNSVGYGIYMHTNGDLIFEAGEDDGGYIQRGSTSVIDNSIDKDTWVFLTITHDAAAEEIKWYKNGDWKQTKSSGAHWNGGPIGTNTLPLSIGFGEGGSTSGGHFSGIIDEPKVYSRALTLSEIKKNWKASKSKHKDNTVSNWSDDFTNDFI